LSLLSKISGLLPMLQAEGEDFPFAAMDALRATGLLLATTPDGDANDPENLCKLLMLLGQGNLAVARLFEAHVNALLLIARYGEPAILADAVRDAAFGHLFGLWVTDPPAGGVTVANGVFTGRKVFCSGAGQVTRALITAGDKMFVVNVEAARLLPGLVSLAGMKGAITTAVDFSTLTGTPIGGAGDYLREPVFSAGAWRSSAGAVGGLAALLQAYGAEIKQRGRTENPAQRARFGQAVMAFETARLWIFKAARHACLEDDTPEAVVAYVNLARLAIERACLEAMQLAQRSLGLSAFAIGARVERLSRDLSTFLRQPAPDEVLDIAAGHYFAHAPEDVDASSW